MNPTEQLRDIRGLDAISWWPPAPGWWVLLGLMVLISTMGLLIYHHRFLRKKRRNDWRIMARQEWLGLRPVDASSREQMTLLSVLLRRIAMQRHGRDACAGLSGEDWLSWLAKHDPQGFDWTQSGRILVELPYMPPDTLIDGSQVDEVYRAIRVWIDEPLSS